MTRYVFIIIASIFFISCQEKPSQVEKELKAFNLEPLNTVAERKAFLQNILDGDKGIREKSTSIQIEFGSDSNEYFTLVEEMNKVDDLNLAKIHSYLKKYDYPDAETYGKNLSVVPILVVHHSNNDNVRRDFYPQFKTAYDQGRLEAAFFALYLGRMYEFEKGSYYRMESPYMIEDQIDSLITQLDLR